MFCAQKQAKNRQSSTKEWLEVREKIGDTDTAASATPRCLVNHTHATGPVSNSSRQSTEGTFVARATNRAPNSCFSRIYIMHHTYQIIKKKLNVAADSQVQQQQHLS